MRYLVEVGSRWLELNPARTQQKGHPCWDATSDPKYATVFATEALAQVAADEFKAHNPDWPVEVRKDWRVCA